MQKGEFERRKEKWVSDAEYHNLGSLAAGALARLRRKEAQEGCRQCIDPMLKGVHTCSKFRRGLDDLYDKALSQGKVLHDMLRLGKGQVAERPDGEVYLLESEVMEKLGRKTLEDL